MLANQTQIRGGRSIIKRVYSKVINMTWYNRNGIFRAMADALMLVVLAFLLAGCGMGLGTGHHDSDTSSSEGYFMDSPVQGLNYETETHSGTTGEDGSFSYEDGEMVTFKMGSMTLGTSRGARIITPIDMVPGAFDENHPAVTNMLRFMQTMDEDNNPENGITLPYYMMDELEGRPINFYMDPDSFENDPTVMMFMNDMQSMHDNYAGRMMVTAEDAQAHMRNTMMSMMGGNYDPNNMQGSFVDSPVQGLHYETETHSGTTNEDGHFNYSVGEAVTFSMGGMNLGQAHGNAIITPIDMVPGATDENHPTVTNMLRFLQTMDEDNNPENGINFPQYMMDELAGRTIQFDMNIEDFENNSDIQMFMETMGSMYGTYANRMIASASEAQEHMRNSMMNLQQVNDGSDSNLGDDMMGEDQKTNGDMMDGGQTNGGMDNGDMTGNDDSYGGGGGMMM